MATRYWRGGTATWDATAGSKWAATSGGATGAAVPTAADDVYFDATSTGTCTLSASSTCRSLDCNGFTGTISHPTGITLNVGDATAGASNIALRFDAGMTYTIGSATAAISLRSTSTTQQAIATGGKTLGNLTLGGGASPPKYALSSALTVTSTGAITHNRGTFDSAGYTVTAGQFASTGTNTRTLTLGSSSLNFSSNSTAVALTATGLTISANTASWNVTGDRISPTGTVDLNGGSVATAPGVIGTTGTTGALICASFTRTGPAATTAELRLFADLTVTGACTLAGNSTTNRMLIWSGTVGTQRTITANGTITVSNADFMDIAAAGSASWNLAAITGGSGDALGNTGITFTTPTTQTFAGGTANWSSASAWTSRVPLPQDSVVIASTTAGTLTVDMVRIGADINCTGFTRELMVGSNPTIYGSLTLNSTMTFSPGSHVITFAARSSKTIDLSTKNLGDTNVTINAPGGTYTLNSDMNVSVGTASLNPQFMLSYGTFDANGYNVKFNTFTSPGTATRSLIMGTGTWTLASTSAATLWNMVATGLTISGASATLLIPNASTNTRIFAGGGFTYGTLTYTVAGSTGALTVTGANTFGTVNFSDASNARTLTLPASTVTTVTGTFNVNGTAGKLMSVVSSVASTAATLSKASGVVSSDYLSLQDSTATGGAAWYAGANSTSVSGNTGWVFTAPPSFRPIVMVLA